MARKNHVIRVARDLVTFALENKRWWVLPIVAVSLLFVALLVAANSPLSPFVYTLF